MREDRHDDLVSTTAIVAGTVAGVAVTVMSLLLSGDESVPPEPAAPDAYVVEVVEPVQEAAPSVAVERQIGEQSGVENR